MAGVPFKSPLQFISEKYLSYVVPTAFRMFIDLKGKVLVHAGPQSADFKYSLPSDK